MELATSLSSASAGTIQEASRRSAVSRAYYAAFCHARNYARDKLLFHPTYEAADHTSLRDHYNMQGMPDVAIWLQQLRGWRNNCDYRDMVPGLAPMVASAMADAQKVISKLK